MYFLTPSWRCFVFSPTPVEGESYGSNLPGYFGGKIQVVGSHEIVLMEKNPKANHLICMKPVVINNGIFTIWVFPKIGVSPKWMVYNGKPY